MTPQQDGGLLISITANTTLATGDVGSPGDPYILIDLNGETVLETDELERRPRLSIEREIPATAIPSGEVTVSVTLLDADLVGDDTVATWSTTTTQPGSTATPSTTTVPTTAPTTTRGQQTTENPTTTSTRSTVVTTTTRVTATRTQPTTTRSTATTTPTSTTVTPSPTTTTTKPPTTTTQQQTEWTVTVVQVVDGDTFTVRFSDGRTDDVRLLGVDTPEVHADNNPDEFEGIPDTEASRDWLRDWGHKASEFARAEIGDTDVRITVDETADRRDKYGRLLVYVHLPDGTVFNEELLAKGYARVYDTSFAQRPAFETAEQQAQRNDVGLWGFTAQTTTTTTEEDNEGQLAVASIQADAPGNDHENLNEEYIVFENTGDVPLDLSGWSVRDEADHGYRFPSEFVLDPGDQVTLYTGSGTNTQAELYWGSGRAIWNNGGDTIIVTDDEGEIAIRKEYS